MSTEQRTIAITAYRDRDGNPTCATDFVKGEVCVCYATARFGGHETCIWAERRRQNYSEPMRRRNGGAGTLIPLSNCPVWSEQATAGEA